MSRPTFKVVFTLPAPIRDLAYHNKSVLYNILFKAAAETLLTIAADPKHLGAHLATIGKARSGHRFADGTDTRVSTPSTVCKKHVIGMQPTRQCASASASR